jgi:ribulose-5-phosphate 4-epimerase/fuculose-1-phosphate aldolase
VGGDAPTKEALLHLAMYRERARDAAVVHLHATHSVAVSVLADVDPADVLPPLTAYYAMRIGTLPLVPYFAPGDAALANAVAGVATRHHALLLANHGPVVSGVSLDAAADAIEELEATAKLWLLVRGDKVRLLDAAALADIARRYPR